MKQRRLSIPAAMLLVLFYFMTGEPAHTTSKERIASYYSDIRLITTRMNMLQLSFTEKQSATPFSALQMENSMRHVFATS